MSYPKILNRQMKFVQLITYTDQVFVWIIMLTSCVAERETTGTSCERKIINNFYSIFNSVFYNYGTLVNCPLSWYVVSDGLIL